MTADSTKQTQDEAAAEDAAGRAEGGEKDTAGKGRAKPATAARTGKKAAATKKTAGAAKKATASTKKATAAKAKEAPETKAAPTAGAAEDAAAKPASGSKPAPAKKAGRAKKSAATKGGLLRITQVRSQIGFAKPQRRVLRGLGLGRIGRTVTRPDDACIRGMVTKVAHLVRVEEVKT